MGRLHASTSASTSGEGLLAAIGRRRAEFEPQSLSQLGRARIVFFWVPGLFEELGLRGTRFWFLSLRPSLVHSLLFLDPRGQNEFGAVVSIKRRTSNGKRRGFFQPCQRVTENCAFHWRAPAVLATRGCQSRDLSALLSVFWHLMFLSVFGLLALLIFWWGLQVLLFVALANRRACSSLRLTVREASEA